MTPDENISVSTPCYAYVLFSLGCQESNGTSFGTTRHITCGPRKNNMQHAFLKSSEHISEKIDDGEICSKFSCKFSHQKISIKISDVDTQIRNVEN